MKLNFFAVVLAIPLMCGCNTSKKEPTAVTLNKHEVTMSIGDREQLIASITPYNATNKNVIWSIDTETDAISLNEKGLVTALKAGNARVVVTTEVGGYTDYCSVSVRDPKFVDGVTLNPSYLTMQIGQERVLTPTVTPETAIDKTVSYLTSDEAVATVSSTGVVSAIGEGICNISCITTDGGFTAVCPVKVERAKGEDDLWDNSQDSLRNGSKTLDFYSLNDFHGSVEMNSSEPGMTRLSTYIKSKKNNNEDGFVFTSSGDMWQGSADSNITCGRLVTDWMNMLNCSAMALGNHEFDWTIDVIERNQVYANFDFLACNIIRSDDRSNVDLAKPYTTITRNGVHIGIIGAIGEGITSSIVASNVKGLTFADPNPYIVSWNEYLRNHGADIVLVIYHGKVNEITASTGYKIDGVFGGHTHQFEDYTIGRSPAIQASCNGKGLGHIKINYDFAEPDNTTRSGEYFRTYDLCKNLEEDALVKNMYQTYLDTEIMEVKSEVVSTYTGGIKYETIPYVYNQYALQYYEDTYEDASQYKVEFVWTNQARSAIYASAKGITYGDLYKALPFDNSLCLMRITGREIAELFNRNYGYVYDLIKGNTTPNQIASRYENDNKYHYFLVINYIIESEYYAHIVTPETYAFTFLEEDALPRNILKRYLKDYPSNFAN